MRIGLDFDGTLTADPDMFAEFVEMADLHGHSVVIVTARMDTPENRKTVKDYLNFVLLPDVNAFFTSHRSKVESMKEAGMPVDVWIDDDPKTCALGV